LSTRKYFNTHHLLTTIILQYRQLNLVNVFNVSVILIDDTLQATSPFADALVNEALWWCTIAFCSVSWIRLADRSTSNTCFTVSIANHGCYSLCAKVLLVYSTTFFANYAYH